MRKILTFLCLLVGAWVCSYWAEASDFTGVGFLAGGFSILEDVSADGQTVVGIGISGGAFVPVAYQTFYSGGLFELPGPDNFDGLAVGITADGGVAVGTSQGQARLWEPIFFGPTAIHAIPLASPFRMSQGYAISPSGQFVSYGVADPTSGVHEIYLWDRWLNIVSEPYGELSSGRITSISDTGRAVGFNDGRAMILDKSGKMTHLFPGFFLDISADGDLMVGTDGRPVLWNGTLIPLSNKEGQATSISTNGRWVVGTTTTPFIVRSSGGPLLELDLPPDWTSMSAMGVSDDGQTVVGTGVNPQGNVEGWIWVSTLAVQD